MKKIYTYLIFSFALLCSTSLIAQTNEKARETAVMIADRILKSTTYDFVDKKSGKTYTSLKNVPLNKECESTKQIPGLALHKRSHQHSPDGVGR